MLCALTLVACAGDASDEVEAPAPPPAATWAMTERELADAEAGFYPPRCSPHVGLHETRPEDRRAYRARYRETLRRLASFLDGCPSALETTWADPARRASLAVSFRFASPPSDDATVDRLRAFLYTPPPRSDRDMLSMRCANWILTRIGSEHAVAVLVDEMFAEPMNTFDAMCALDMIVEPRHAALIRSSYARAAAGIIVPHVTFVNYAAPFLTRFDLLDLVRDDLASDDAERVYRGLQFAARLPGSDGEPMLTTYLARRDVPDPVDHPEWGGVEGLRNVARYSLEHARALLHVGARPTGCSTWACQVPTHPPRSWSGCSH